METTALPIRILSVDDNQSMAQVVPAWLRDEPRLEYVMHLPNATALCEFVAIHKIDVVLLDMLMPGPDPVTEMRRTLEAFPFTRFIVVTAAEEAAGPALAAGASAVVEKESASRDLVATIFLAMGRRAEARAGRPSRTVAAPRTGPRAGGEGGDSLTRG